MAIARTGSNFPNSAFSPEIWSLKLQSKFYATSVLDQIANHDWEGDIKNKGDKVMVRVIPDVLISDYTANGTINYQNINDEKVELTIDHAKVYAFKLDDVDAVQFDVNAMNMLTKDAAEQMKSTVDAHVLGAVYSEAPAANTVASVQITKATVLTQIFELGRLMDEQNLPDTGRWLVIPPWVAQLVKDSDLAKANESGDATSIRRNGRLGMIDRLTVYVSNHLALVSPDYKVLAGTKHAVTFASQFVKHETLRLENTFGDAVRGLKVYGFKTIQPKALFLGNWKK